MLTFGHGRLNATELTELVEGAASPRWSTCVGFLAAVRTTRPRKGRSRGCSTRSVSGIAGMSGWAVGGHSLSPRTSSRRTPCWRVKAFRAFAAWTRTDSLRAALPQLLAAPDTCALMCSEAVWWRCHRRLISDVLVLEYGVVARHLMHDGRLIDHVPSPGARRDERGWLVWDGPR